MEKSFVEYCEGDRIVVDIPEGFYFKEGNIKKGYVIESEIGRNQYLRIPSGYTSDGVYIRGFWISRYEISMPDGKNPRSIAGEYPLTNINFYKAIEIALRVNGDIFSKEEYNRICMWLVKTKAAKFGKVFIKGNGMGNYSKPFIPVKTGLNPDWMFNNLDCFWGNCYTWTKEKSELYDHHRIIRGGPHSNFNTGNNNPPSYRAWAKPEEGRPDIGMRIIIKDKRD